MQKIHLLSGDSDFSTIIIVSFGNFQILAAKSRGERLPIYASTAYQSKAVSLAKMLGLQHLFLKTFSQDRQLN